jgi:hypothetical protein
MSNMKIQVLAKKLNHQYNTYILEDETERTWDI